jgi:hypothetical protein
MWNILPFHILSNAVIQSNFRRASLTDHGVEKIPAARIPGIFGQMGQKYDSKKLTQWMEKLDAKSE